MSIPIGIVGNTISQQQQAVSIKRAMCSNLSGADGISIKRAMCSNLSGFKRDVVFVCISVCEGCMNLFGCVGMYRNTGLRRCVCSV